MLIELNGYISEKIVIYFVLLFSHQIWRICIQYIKVPFSL